MDKARNALLIFRVIFEKLQILLEKSMSDLNEIIRNFPFKR